MIIIIIIFHIKDFIDLKYTICYVKEKLLRKKIINLTLDLKGSISAEHGIGVARKDDLKKYMKKDVEVFKSIKKSFDPKNIMNPGKVVDI